MCSLTNTSLKNIIPQPKEEESNWGSGVKLGSLFVLIISFFILAKANIYLRPKIIDENQFIACEKAEAKRRSHTHSGGRDPSAAFILVLKHVKGHLPLFLALIASIVLIGEARLIDHSGMGLDSYQVKHELGRNGGGLDHDRGALVRATFCLLF